MERFIGLTEWRPLKFWVECEQEARLTGEEERVKQRAFMDGAEEVMVLLGGLRKLFIGTPPPPTPESVRATTYSI